MKTRTPISLMFIVLAIVFLTGTTRAQPTFSFVNITNNSAIDAAIGEARLFVQVSDPGSELVLFDFFNTGTDASSITDIYFDDGALANLISIDNSDPPVQPNGVNPGESEGLTFSLTGIQTFDDVLDDLTSTDLRIGIHVQGFAGGGSESFINNGVTNGNGNGVIPAPMTIVLSSIGLCIIGWLRRIKTL